MGTQLSNFALKPCNPDPSCPAGLRAAAPPTQLSQCGLLPFTSNELMFNLTITHTQQPKLPHEPFALDSANRSLQDFFLCPELYLLTSEITFQSPHTTAVLKAPRKTNVNPCTLGQQPTHSHVTIPLANSHIRTPIPAAAAVLRDSKQLVECDLLYPADCSTQTLL